MGRPRQAHILPENASHFSACGASAAGCLQRLARTPFGVRAFFKKYLEILSYFCQLAVICSIIRKEAAAMIKETAVLDP